MLAQQEPSVVRQAIALFTATWFVGDRHFDRPVLQRRFTVRLAEMVLVAQVKRSLQVRALHLALDLPGQTDNFPGNFPAVELR